MPRFLSTARLKSVPIFFWDSTAPRIGRKYTVGVIEESRKLGTSSENVERDSFWRNLGGKGYYRRGQMQEEIVSALCAGEGKRASSLLSELVCGSPNLQSDRLFVEGTWELMKKKGIALSGRCYFRIIRAFCKCGYLEEAFSIARTLDFFLDISPTLPVYNSLLQAYTQPHNLHSTNEFWNWMEQKSVAKSEITYAILLQLAVSVQNLSAVHKYWEEVIKNYNLSIIMLRKFVESFTKLKDLEFAYAALQQMVNVASKCKLSFAKTAEGKWHQCRLDIPIPCHTLTWDSNCKDNYITLQSPSKLYKKEDSYSKLYKGEDSNKSRYQVNFGMEADHEEKPFHVAVMKFLRWSFNDVIHASASMKNVLMAEQLVLQMQSIGLRPSPGTYDGYIRALVSANGFRDGIEVLKAMQQNNLRPLDSTLATLSISCSRALELDLAENFLDQIPNCPNAYPYNALFEACDTMDQPERAVQVWKKMKCLNVLPNIRTYELLFKLFANVNAPYEDGNLLSQGEADRRIDAIIQDMRNNGIQHNDVSMQNLLKSLGMEGNIKELIKCMNKSSFQNTAIYDTALHSLVEAKETDTAIQIFKSMISREIPPKETTYAIMVDCCSIIKCYRSACALVSLMIRSGLCLSIVTYTAFIKVLLEFEDFDEALKLLERGSSEGVQPDVIAYNTILQAANVKGRIDVIELIVEQMHQEKIEPDTSTCAHVFSAYADNGFDTTAMEALQVLSMRMISEEDDILVETMSKYGNLIFDEDSDVESQIIGGFKESPNLAMALLHLRWCATFAFPVSWSPNQSPWAKRLSSDYALRQAGVRN